MYTQEVAIEIHTSVDKDEIYDEMSLLMSYYRSNGQTQGKIESQYLYENRVVCLPFTLEESSLNEGNNNLYVSKQIAKLEQLCDSNLQIKTLGLTSEKYLGPCRCDKPNFYILMTNYITIDSALNCGICNKSIPLYRLPKLYDHGYRTILSWETNYQACDSLQMNCEVGERWALNQMQKIDSQLSKQGIEVCKMIEEADNTPTYYSLFNYRKQKRKGIEELCPKCKSEWTLDQKLHNFYDYKCDRCRIISTVSMNS